MVELTRSGTPPSANGELPPTPILLGALEATADGLLVTDLDGNTRYYNRRLLELLDISAKVLADRTFAEALEGSLSLFRTPERFIEVVEGNLENPDEETRHEFELRDGRIVERVSRPLRIGTETAGRVTSIRDVTELRENERCLQNAQQLARVGSWEWDIQEDEVHSSDELYRIFGVDPETFEDDLEAFLGRAHPEDRGRVRQELEKAI